MEFIRKVKNKKGGIKKGIFKMIRDERDNGIRDLTLSGMWSTQSLKWQKAAMGAPRRRPSPGYGKLWEDNFATLLKMKTKMSSVSSTAHKIPITVCL